MGNQVIRHQHINTIAKQVVMPSYWLAINSGSLGFDRTPESHRFLRRSVS